MVNSLVRQAAADRHSDHGYSCATCGAPVSTYNCNAALGEQRPEAYGVWDWFAACDNGACFHAWGEGYSINGLPDWVVRRAAEKEKEPSV